MKATFSQTPPAHRDPWSWINIAGDIWGLVLGDALGSKYAPKLHLCNLKLKVLPSVPGHRDNLSQHSRKQSPRMSEFAVQHLMPKSGRCWRGCQSPVRRREEAVTPGHAQTTQFAVLQPLPFGRRQTRLGLWWMDSAESSR